MPLAPLSPTSHVKIGGTPGPGIAGESGPIPMISVSSGAPPTPSKFLCHTMVLNCVN